MLMMVVVVEVVVDVVGGGGVTRTSSSSPVLLLHLGLGLASKPLGVISTHMFLRRSDSSTHEVPLLVWNSAVGKKATRETYLSPTPRQREVPSRILAHGIELPKCRVRGICLPDFHRRWVFMASHHEISFSKER